MRKPGGSPLARWYGLLLILCAAAMILCWVEAALHTRLLSLQDTFSQVDLKSFWHDAWLDLLRHGMTKRPDSRTRGHNHV